MMRVKKLFCQKYIFLKFRQSILVNIGDISRNLLKCSLAIA